MKKYFLIIAPCIVLFSCKEKSISTEHKRDILIENRDTTINPADDFFDYTNGGWIKNNPIPGDETKWGIGQLVNEELYNRKKTINDLAVSKKATSGVDQQIADFWITAMDTIAIEKGGITPLNAILQEINSAKNSDDIMAVSAHLHRIGVPVFFGRYIGQDPKNSELISLMLGQGGLGLPNRDYYFNTDERTTKIRDAYIPYVSKIISQAYPDTNTSNAKAKAVYAIELKLATASRKLEALRDPYANYNKMSLSGLTSLAPAINWASTFEKMGLPKIDTLIIGQPEFFNTLNGVVKFSIDDLKDYLTFHLINTYAPFLTDNLANLNFDFYGKTIYGAKAQRPRWKRVLDAQEDAMGEALGQLFAKEYFNETAKKRYSDMVENVRNAYKARIEKLDWMSDSTKQKALHKLAAISKKVGYPDKWKDFSSLKIDRSSFAQNMMSANEWWNKYSINKLGKPVDRTEWDMTPQTYNAYYNPSNNEIVLPAGIFTVPGMRDEELDDALVYGYAAASTIGHEITHGFDDEGRQFDEKGNLKNWWSKEDEEQFKKRAEVLVHQFNKMTPVDTMHINGRATLGENLADLGGLLIGLDAFKQTDAYKKGEKLNGLTPLQRYFMGYALGWMYSYRKESIASQIMTDVHAPVKERVNGPMPNIPEFYEAFNISPSNKMHLGDSLRVKLW